MDLEITYQAERLLAEFFPNTNDERGFYENFDPNPLAHIIAPQSPVGEKLLSALGIYSDDGRDFYSHNDPNVKVGQVMLLRIPGERGSHLYFAGYWDGDGVAICGREYEPMWAMTTDVKCPEVWFPIHQPIKSAREMA